ncbi:TonB-dependent receptor domain-containing protein [Gluconobacter thailandicus]|uniref:TonB-dependent receptor domain-containing protein n=1 Tax=Gluconobacter thailandicus TaxID=257438 RepID=UPI0006620956|nr:TonB-dependent receptor [Gluconobacter thailandicus]KXV52839.1 TonB-dependent receptor [Gluconobacter thailandicus]
MLIHSKTHRALLLLGATVLSTQSALAAATASQATSHKKTHHRTPSTPAPAASANPLVTTQSSTAVPDSGVAYPGRKTTITQAQSDTAQLPAAPSGNESIVVTGTLFRDPNTHSSSPITHLTRQDMQQRGLKTATDVVQQLSSNGAGNLTNAWSAGGGFAAGGSAPSLRGLSTDSTLVLMDGQRNSYYPLADDGVRNFVDTNWIPQSIIEAVDVQQDGGSATYGADAVAGVVNYITRKEIKGFEGNAEGGLSQRGDSGHQRLYATFGHGDLHRDGYNFYINGEYQQDDPLYYRQLQSPYNNGDLTGLGGVNGNTNALSPDGTINSTFFSATPAAVVRPVTPGATRGTGPYTLLNQSAGCSSVGQLVSGNLVSAPGGATQTCMQNSQQYAQVAPDQRRIEGTAHFTANVTDRSQLVAMFNWSQTRTITTDSPSAIGVYTQGRLATSSLTLLPVTINGQLNPNNPYAAQGEQAQILGTFGNVIPTTTQTTQNYRGSVRYSGWEPSKWGSDWNYDVNFVGMNSLLDQTYTGVPTINGINNAINNGTYNFVDPSQNSRAVLNSIFPVNTIHARTQEYSGEATANKGLFKLPGGMVKLAIGGNIRWESLNDPSANPINYSDLGAQYTSKINPVSAQGQRWVEAGFYELDIPVVKMLDINTSGRYDNYSEGFHHFSPKVGVQFKPFRELTLRGTFSKGFRVPSFAETGGKTVGYTGWTVDNPAWQASHGNNAYSQGTSIGLQNVGNPNLKPETSTNISAGPIFKPTSWMTLDFEYWYIKKNNYITGNTLAASSVANSWLNCGNTCLPSGITVTPNPVDPQYPDAQPSPGIISAQYVNARSLMTDGFDFGIEVHHRLPGIFHDVMWYSKGQGTYVRRFNQTNPDGTVYRFAGTLGPYSAVSASGTPHWRANWSNTLTWKNLAVTPTVYYTSGYKTVADDSGSSALNANGVTYSRSCAGTLSGSTNNNAPTTQCKVKGFWDVDLTVNYKVNQRWSVYANVYNLLGFRAPLDYATYGGYLYNSSWTQKGIVLRSFQFGVNVAL